MIMLNYRLKVTTPNEYIKELLLWMCADYNSVKEIIDRAEELAYLSLIQKNCFDGYSAAEVGLGAVLGSCEIYNQQQLFSGLLFLIEDSKLEFNVERGL